MPPRLLKCRCWLFVIGFLLALNSKTVLADESQPPSDKNSKLWITTGFFSYHPNREAHYNERNTGIGMEYRFDEDQALALGHYKNSIRRESTYLQYVYTPLKIGNIGLGGAVGIVDGYPRLRHGKFSPVLMPVANMTFKVFGYDAGINAVYIPSIIPNVDGAFAIQFKVGIK